MISPCSLCVPLNVSSQRLGKHFPAATNTCAPQCFMLSVSYQILSMQWKERRQLILLRRFHDCECRQTEGYGYESRGTWKQKLLYRRRRAAMYSIDRRTDSSASGVGVLTADSQSTSSSGYRASLWDPWPDFILLFFLRLTITLFFIRRRLLWRENGSVVYSAITQ
jgi:hypothetical protein